jgi:gliding motility-associated protein GldE
LEPIYSTLLLNISTSANLAPIIISAVLLLILLISSALISGSEVAFFSLTPSDVEELNKDTEKSSKTILELLEKPKTLLATILISNNFINVSIIIISTYLSTQFFEGWEYKTFFDIVVITFVILLFGEVIPKIYATKQGLKMTKLMAIPLRSIGNFFLINILRKGLVSGTSFISNMGTKKSVDVSSDDLEHALMLTKEESLDGEDHKILEGIVKFGSKDVKQIMKSRTDVTAFDLGTPYNELYKSILESGYSRLPIFDQTFDQISGILFVKDLIPFIDESDNFDWTTLLRSPYFVPETKKIDDLLKSFQEKKMHMAIVVDEFGGTSGLVTLEDVLEEIVGEITDEFDVDEISYSKLDDNTYIFEGKTPLVDFYKVLEIEGNSFEEVKGESDTLAGFIIEQAGKILLKNEKLTFDNINFIVESADKRKVKRIKVIIQNQNNES